MKNFTANPGTFLNARKGFFGMRFTTALLFPIAAISQSPTGLNLRSDSNFVVLAGSLCSQENPV